jgi:two-component system, NtrC family, response regulator HydG
MNKNPEYKMVVIDDDRDILDLVEAFFRPRGFKVIGYEDPEVALREVSQHSDADVVVTDWSLPGMNGLELTEKLKQAGVVAPIILITARQSSELALQAVDAGAYDFILKPLHFPQLWISIQRALRWKSVSIENNTLRQAIKVSQGQLEGVVSKSAQFRGVIELCRRVAATPSTVLITGESGSGKEVISKALHHFSPRKDKPFVAINCSAIPETLLESELFGYAKGAFTGAADKRIGLFEEANEGTLFLDEIGDLSPSLQAKLLRVLQERKIRRIGENQTRNIDVRIVCATHKDLKFEVKEKRFREDLFFRLNVIPIHIPPLRERKEDLWPLAEFFTHRFCTLNNVAIKSWSKDAIQYLHTYQWPGNVRELENAVERSVALSVGSEITEQDLILFDKGVITPVALSAENTLEMIEAEQAQAMRPMGDVFLQDSVCSLEDLTRKYIEFALKKNDGAREATARALGIDRKTLYRKLRQMQDPGAAAVPSYEH